MTHDLLSRWVIILSVSCALLLATASATAQTAIRLWFETVQSGPLSQTDPVLTESATLYLWAQPNDARIVNWTEVTFNLDLDGNALIEGCTLYNAEWVARDGTPYIRWSQAHRGAAMLPAAEINNNLFTAVVQWNNYGVMRPVLPDTITVPPLGIPGTDAASQSTLLAELTVRYDGPGEATLWLEHGRGGFNRPDGVTTDRVFFGHGDSGLRRDEPAGTRSELPEVRFIPEPGGAVMIVALLAVCRRMAREGR